MEASKRFSFLSEQERLIIFSYEQGSSKPEIIVDLMLGLTEQYRIAPDADKRANIRAKLLGLAGVYESIPVEKFEKAKSAALALNFLELRIEDKEDPLRALMRCGDVPFDIICNLPGLSEFFSVKQPNGISYKQALMIKQASIGGILISLKSDIKAESNEYMSASSEPLTRSIILNPFLDKPGEEIRDFVSMTYDLILQIEFLDIFYSCKEILDRTAIQVCMRLAGLRFVLDTFSILLKRAVEGKHLEFELNANELLIENRDGNAGQELVNFLYYILYELGLSAVDQITQIVGLQDSEREVGKVLIEHPISFDPRRVKMRIV